MTSEIRECPKGCVNKWCAQLFGGCSPVCRLYEERYNWRKWERSRWIAQANEVQYERMCEHAAFGEFLIRTIAELLKCEPNQRAIQEAFRKTSCCGAFVVFDVNGIMVGSVVEAYDAEVGIRVIVEDLDTDDAGAEELKRRFRKVVSRMESEVDRILTDESEFEEVE
jgi:hypothetical protein